MELTRPTDAERESLVGRLSDAFGNGTLSLEDFQGRLDAVYEVETVDDLEQLTRGLPEAGRPASRRIFRRRWLALASIGAALVPLFAVAAAMRPSGVDVPIVTGLGVTNPLDSGSDTVIRVKWPRWAKDGFVQYSVTGGQTAPASRSGPPDRFINYGHHDWPISYRAGACRSQCRTTDPESDPIYGPWYRPQVGAVLGEPPPDITGSWNADIGRAVFTINLGAHSSAPAVAVFRNGAPFVVLTNETLRTGSGVLHFDDPSPPRAAHSSSSEVSYAVAACYSDCFGPAFVSGFAQATPPGIPTTITVERIDMTIPPPTVGPSRSPEGE